MTSLTDKQIAAYFHRCYTTVDGLWFMKAEEKFGFDTALELDGQVWKVLPKIQARWLKATLEAPPGLDGLRECLTTKLALEGFGFEVTRHEAEFEVTITRCPWHDLMVKSGRAHLSAKVGRRICDTEYSVWAAEFGTVQVAPRKRICEGGAQCGWRFTAPSQEPSAQTVVNQ